MQTSSRNENNGSKLSVKKVMSYVSTALIAAALITVIAILISVLLSIGKGKTPSVFGYQVYNVLTDSMTDTLNPGDVIISKKVTEKNVRELQKGDIITYVAETGEVAGQLVTHRIVEGIHYDGVLKAEVVSTKGDKAGARVDYPVRLERIQSVMVRKSDALAWLYKSFRSGAGFALIVIIPLGIMLISLVVRLVQTLRNPEEAKTAMTEGNAESLEAEREAKIEEIKARAIAEYEAGKKAECEESREG